MSCQHQFGLKHPKMFRTGYAVPESWSDPDLLAIRTYLSATMSETNNLAETWSRIRLQALISRNVFQSSIRKESFGWTAGISGLIAVKHWHQAHHEFHFPTRHIRSSWLSQEQQLLSAYLDGTRGICLNWMSSDELADCNTSARLGMIQCEGCNERLVDWWKLLKQPFPLKKRSSRRKRSGTWLGVYTTNAWRNPVG
jgi:hypothetical protein